jgi:hypothetical protein
MKTVSIVVLDDVWMGSENASVCIITQEEYEKLCDGEIRTRDLNPIHEFTLKDVSQ